MKVITVTSGAHKPERATPRLGLCDRVFTDRFFLDTFQSTFSRENGGPPSVHERIINVRCDNGKLNVTKRSKMSFSGVLVLLTGLWEDIRHSRENRSKNKLVSENAVTRVYGRCSPRL